jgi:hypothetical protein
VISDPYPGVAWDRRDGRAVLGRHGRPAQIDGQPHAGRGVNGACAAVSIVVTQHSRLRAATTRAAMWASSSTRRRARSRSSKVRPGDPARHRPAIEILTKPAAVADVLGTMCSLPAASR